MQIIRVENLEQAVRYARQCQAEGEFDLFRGQVERWPMVPTILRLPDAVQDAAHERFGRFVRWIEGNPEVAAMLPTIQSRYAVAQHYGLPTSMLDVTSDPRIAGFFAAHAGRPPAPGTESCIYCFHSETMRAKSTEMYHKALEDGFSEDDIDLPFHFSIDVSNLWRLQAQFGSFVVAPDWLAREPELRVLEHLFEATALVFPFTGPLAAVPQQLVYPDRKSALEIRLDEWFAQEDVAEFQREARAAGHTVIDARVAKEMLGGMDLEALGFKPEVVELYRLRLTGAAASVFEPGGDIAPHASWTLDANVAPFLDEVCERFDDVLTAMQWRIVAGDHDDLNDLEEECCRRVRRLLDRNPGARQHTVAWRLVDAAGRELCIAPQDDESSDDARRTAAAWLDVVWDGVRALAYSDDEVALAMGRTAAALSWAATGRDPFVWEPHISLELVLAMGFDPVVIVPEVVLRAALRRDLSALLTSRWRYLASEPSHLLLVEERPWILFDFVSWRRLFAGFFIPSQVVRNATSGGTMAVYNPLLPVAVRKH